MDMIFIDKNQINNYIVDFFCNKLQLAIEDYILRFENEGALPDIEDFS